MGPVQVLVVGFEQPKFSGEVLAELTRLRDAGVVRLIDLLLVEKTEDGALQTLETSDLPGEWGTIAAAVLTDGVPDETGAPSDDDDDSDLWSLAEAIPAGSAAAVALIEHLWAEPLRDAIRRAGGTPLDEAWLAAEDLDQLETLVGPA